MQSFKEYLLKEQTTSPTSVPWLELELENKEVFVEASGINYNPRYLNALIMKLISLLKVCKLILKLLIR